MFTFWWCSMHLLSWMRYFEYNYITTYLLDSCSGYEGIEDDGRHEKQHQLWDKIHPGDYRQKDIVLAGHVWCQPVAKANEKWGFNEVPWPHGSQGDPDPSWGHQCMVPQGISNGYESSRRNNNIDVITNHIVVYFYSSDSWFYCVVASFGTLRKC